MFRRVWKWFWRPSVAWGIGPLLVVGGIGGVIFWGGFHTAMESTNTLEFCTSCHTMSNTVYKEYKETVHYSNPSGVRAICTDCHVPREWQHMVVAKIKATKDLYHHFITRKIDTPELFEEHRADMARKVWAQMEASDSRECRNCHSYDAMAFHEQSKKGGAEMQVAMEQGETCISCHKGIAHKMPDLSGGYKKKYKEIQSMSADIPRSADILYAIAEIPFFMDASEVGEGRGAGTVMSATEVQVIDREKDNLKIRVEGWRQQGADRIFYELKGHRIFTATLSPKALDQVTVGEATVDPNTDLTWMPVSIEGWVPAKGFIEERDVIWDYTEEMYTAACSSCHGKPDPHHYLANQWIGTLKSMERFISLDKREYRVLLKYLQLNGSDTAGHHNAH